MAVKHSTIPAGADQPGFAGVTPSIWAQQHTFSGGTQGAVLVYDNLNSDNSAWIASAAGFLLSSGTNVLPSFTATIPFATSFSVNSNANLIISIRNLSGGGSAASTLTVANDVDAGLGQFIAFSSGTASVGMAGPSIVNLRANGTLNIGTTGGSNVQVFTNNTLALIVGANTSTFSGSNAGGGQQVQVVNTHSAGSGQFAGFLAVPDNGIGNTLSMTQYSASANPGFADGPGGINGCAAIYTNSTVGLALGNNAAGPIGFYAGSSLHQRWGINSSGDWIFGVSSHIADSNGTPSISSGFGGTSSITGQDYAFVVTLGTSPGTTGIVNLGHTYASAPSVVAAYGNAAQGPPGGSFVNVEAVSTTQVTLRYGGGTVSSGDKIHVHVRGF